MTNCMVRSFDHAGYYETRLVLTLAALAVAVWHAVARRDRSLLVAFACGAVLQGYMEYRLYAAGMRGDDYTLSLFGLTLSSWAACLAQGLLEGGVLAMMSYWFVDLCATSDDRLRRARLYAAMCGLIVLLAIVVGMLARGRAVTSPRPIFTEGAITSLTLQSIAMLAIVWCLRGRAFHWLGLFYAGSVLYVTLTFEPLRALGARYIADRATDGAISVVTGMRGFWLVLYSDLFEVAGGKIHYFVIPYALGWLRVGGKRWFDDV